MMMFRMLGVGVAALALAVTGQALQAPAAAGAAATGAAPAGATGKCNDGSYTSAAKKRQRRRGQWRRVADRVWCG